jgi:hypothetical protein
MNRYTLPIIATLLVGCSGYTRTEQEPSTPHSPPTAETPVQPASNNPAPENVNERIAVLEELGFTRDHKTDDYVQYVRGSLTVDLDLCSASISLLMMVSM